MPPVEKSKGLLIPFRGTPQQKVVSIVRCDPRLPSYGVFACSRCVFCFLSYFPAGPQKVPIAAGSHSRSLGKVRLHNRLDVCRAWRVSAKSTSTKELGSIKNEWIEPIGLGGQLRERRWFFTRVKAEIGESIRIFWGV
jgi:hypothetical protein